jgi:CheY-like chemotaxis protein
MNRVRTNRYATDSGTRRRTTGAGGNRTTAHDLSALVVDNDRSTRKMAATMLRTIGYTVCTAGDAAQALLDFSEKSLSLLLTDFEMPVINGYQLGRKIKSEYPGTRVVIMTGMSRAAVKGLMGDEVIDGWLFKPFYLAELKTLLERAALPAKV